MPFPTACCSSGASRGQLFEYSGSGPAASKKNMSAPLPTSAFSMAACSSCAAKLLVALIKLSSWPYWHSSWATTDAAEGGAGVGAPAGMRQMVQPSRVCELSLDRANERLESSCAISISGARRRLGKEDEETTVSVEEHRALQTEVAALRRAVEALEKKVKNL